MEIDYRFRNVGTLAVAIFLQGCGGGGEVGSESGNDVLNIKFPVYELNSAGVADKAKPIIGAKVSVPIGSNFYSISGVTDSSGYVTLSFPKNKSYPKYFFGNVVKDGYATTTIKFLSQVLPNGVLDVGSFDWGLDSGPSLELLGDSIYQASSSSREVIHLGDSNYAGSTNSQFQITSAGGINYDAYFDRELNFTAEQKAKYNYACVLFYARGIQKVNTSMALAGNVKNLNASPLDGSASSNGGCFPIESWTAKFLRISAGLSSNGDYDDFELTNVQVRLRKI